MSYSIRTRDQHFKDPGPKRILALDGGGLRGVLSLGFLARIESILRERHGNLDSFRLCHYFDLIAGTSTGSIIAAALAEGLTVKEIAGHYMDIGKNVFARGWFRDGVMRARYDKNNLIPYLKKVLGADTRMGSDNVQTGLLIITKRTDTGSTWPIGNNPEGRYFKANVEDKWISNADYPLWQVVRASTAAPSFFDPETITIATREDVITTGDFVDGGVSPFNNPSLQAFMYATLSGYRVGWETGFDKLLLVSVGTGVDDPGFAPSRLAAAGALKSLMSLMDDCAVLVETLMQWMSQSQTARVFDREIGDLRDNVLGGKPLLTYMRYNASLSSAEVLTAIPDLESKILASLPRMDEPDNLDVLRTLGEKAADKQVSPHHFPPLFDLS